MVPLPADDGGRIEILNMVHYLKRSGHDIAFVAPQARANDSETFRREVNLHLVELDPRATLFGRFRGAFRSLPYAAERFYSRGAALEIKALVSGKTFDVIHVENLYVMRLGIQMKHYLDLPLVLHQHNLESEIIERYYKSSANPFVRMYAKREHVKTLKFEREMIRQADLIFPITEADRDKLLNVAPDSKFVVLPHGMNFDAFHFGHQFVPDKLLFLSNFQWLPNKDSFRYFCRDIRPRLRETLPALKTIVVGKGIETLDRETYDGSLEYRGFLPDLNAVSSIASIAIVPLRIGSGVRVKILQLMAMGVVVVSTSLGAEGIAARHGEHLIVADTPETMAAEVKRLLEHPDELRRVAVAARAFVEAHHSESAIGAIVNSSYQELIDSRALRRRGR